MRLFSVFLLFCFFFFDNVEGGGETGNGMADTHERTCTQCTQRAK